MKCEWVKQNIVFYIYDELPDDARHELEQHVARYKDCAAEMESLQELRADFAQFPVEEPSPSLLAASRMRLQEALESAEQGGWWSRLIFDPVHWLNQVRFAPALAAAIFIVGFAGGIGATYKLASTPVGPAVNGPEQAPSLASISGISSIQQQPGTNQVTVKYDTVSPQQLTGSLSDPQVQQLLL